jgi:hypothetical protein
MIKENLQELIGLIYDLNELSDERQWFMTFSGHIKGVCIYYRSKEKCGECGSNTGDSIYLTHNAGYDCLEPLIEEVRGYLE